MNRKRKSLAFACLLALAGLILTRTHIAIHTLFTPTISTPQSSTVKFIAALPPNDPEYLKGEEAIQDSATRYALGVEAFIEPKSQAVYLGRKHELYVATSRGVAGISPTFSGIMYDLSQFTAKTPRSPKDVWKAGPCSTTSTVALGASISIVVAFMGLNNEPRFHIIDGVRSDGKLVTVLLTGPDHNHSAEMTLDTTFNPWKLVSETLDGKSLDMNSEAAKVRAR